MSASIPWLSLHNVIHSIEEFRLPIPASRSVLYAGVAAIPVAVLLHDTSDFWMPLTVNIPVVSYFTRRWKKDSDNKELDLVTFRNALIFAWVVAAVSEPEPKAAPMDYVVDRLSNSTTRRILTSDINKARTAAFSAATAFTMGTQDPEKAIQLRDAALRRRQVQEERE